MTMRPAVFVAVLLQASLLGLPQVRAQKPVAPSDEALQSFAAGVAAARSGEWLVALAAFQKTYQLSPRPVVLFNLAGAQVQTGHMLDAQTSYRRFLDDAGDSTAAGIAERRRAAESVLADLKDRIPRVRIDPKGLAAGDRVELDGGAIAWSSDDEIRVDPGPHRLQVRRREATLGAVDFMVAEFEVRTVTWVVPPPALAAAAAAPVPGAPAASRPGVDLAGAAESPRAGSVLRSPWLWGAIMLVAAGAATAGVLVGRKPEPFQGNAGVIVVR